jgi:hypothetical protein
MSTRCNIIVKGDFDEELIFYRHSDGYPDGALPLLNKFVELVQKGQIRSNVGQASGWLVLLGAVEYQTLTPTCFPGGGKEKYGTNHKIVGDAIDSFIPGYWKCGSIEPTTLVHCDIDYLYVVDLTVPAVYQDGEDDYKYQGKFSKETTDA